MKLEYVTSNGELCLNAFKHINFSFNLCHLHGWHRTPIRTTKEIKLNPDLERCSIFKLYIQHIHLLKNMLFYNKCTRFLCFCPLCLWMVWIKRSRAKSLFIHMDILYQIVKRELPLLTVNGYVWDIKPVYSDSLDRFRFMTTHIFRVASLALNMLNVQFDYWTYFHFLSALISSSTYWAVR